jgi:3-oxoacyl-[acyl-carrier protein] reductase
MKTVKAKPEKKKETESKPKQRVNQTVIVGHRVVPPKGPQERRRYYSPQTPDNSPQHDRVCVLTGASGLLGTAFIKRCALDYHIIALHNKTDLAPPQTLVDPLYASFPMENPQVTSIRCDLSKAEEVDAVVDRVINEYGGADLLINAACHRHWSPLLAPGALDDVELSFNLNVVMPLRMTVGFATKFWALRSLEENYERKRNVIHLSSTAGSYVYPDCGQAVYSATKAGLNFAAYHLANELWEIGIRSNTIAPNTFPAIVPTESVLDAMVSLDQSDETGRHVVIDRV